MPVDPVKVGSDLSTVGELFRKDLSESEGLGRRSGPTRHLNERQLCMVRGNCSGKVYVGDDGDKRSVGLETVTLTRQGRPRQVLDIGMPLIGEENRIRLNVPKEGIGSQG